MQHYFLLNSARERISNLSSDSVHDDSIDLLDSLDSSGRRRVDSLQRAQAGVLDDMDLDMDMEQDQVDGVYTTTTTTTTSTSGNNGSVSARGCLETSSRTGVPMCLGCASTYQHSMLQDEDELTSLDRIIRTSSVGSKPELIRRKNRSVPPATQPINRCQSADGARLTINSVNEAHLINRFSSWGPLDE